MLPARPSRERLVSAQGGLGSSPKVDTCTPAVTIFTAFPFVDNGENVHSFPPIAWISRRISTALRAIRKLEEQ